MSAGIDEKTNSAVKSSVTQFETEAKSVRTAISDRGGSPLDRFSEYPADLWLTVGELTVSDDNAPEAVIKNAPVLRVLSDYTVVPFSYKYDYVHGVPEGAYGYNEVQHMVIGGPTGRKYSPSTLLRQSGFENSVTIKEVVHDANVITINPDSTYTAGGVTWANSDVKTSCHTMTCELPDGSKLSVIAYADEIDKFLRAANDNNIRYSANTNWFTYFGGSDQFGNNEGVSLEAKYNEGQSQKYSIVVSTENGTKEYYEWDESTGDPVKSLTSGFPRLAQWLDEHDWNTTSWTLPSACFRNSSIEKFVDVITGINPYVIDDDAFDNCRMLKEVSIAGTLKKIGDRAFRNCYSMTGFDFGKVSSIGESAFENCLSLEEVNIPSSCTEIKSKAFSGCLGLRSINIPKTTKVAPDAFPYDSSIELPVSFFIQTDDDSESNG